LIEYDWRQAASEAAAREDEREHVVVHHSNRNDVQRFTPTKIFGEGDLEFPGNSPPAIWLFVCMKVALPASIGERSTQCF